MSFKRLTVLGCAAFSLSMMTTGSVLAQEAETAADGESAVARIDPQLKAEIAYVEALINAVLPDFAETVIAETKKKWPESEAMFFALEIRGMIWQGKYAEVEAIINKLGEKTSEKYWAARLELANGYFSRSTKEDRDKCQAIYNEFFKANEKPTKGLVTLARTARYQYAQLMLMSGRRAEAAAAYDKLVPMLREKDPDDDDMWLNVSTEAVELHLSVASEEENKDAKAKHLAAANNLLRRLLWRQDKALYFGRAIAMKAHYELLRGSLSRAQGVVDDYWDQLKAIHDRLVEIEAKEGVTGLIRLSPMPQCRFLVAQMYWKQAQDEFKKSPRDDEKIKTLLFGAKKKEGKGRDGKGAYKEAVNVYLRYPQSVWAPAAGKMQAEIAEFTKKNYNVAPSFKATPEQERNVMMAQFKAAEEKYVEGKWKEAIEDYYTVLGMYPETDLSVPALSRLADSLSKQLSSETDKEAKESLRCELDAIELHLAERFGGNPDKAIMSAAGNAALTLAASEKDGKDMERAMRIYDAFIDCYPKHSSAGMLVAALAGDAFKQAREVVVAEDDPADDDATREAKAAARAKRTKLYEDTIRYYAKIQSSFKDSPYYNDSFAIVSVCYENLGDMQKAAAFAEKSLALVSEKEPVKWANAKRRLADLYRTDGLRKIATYEAEPTAEGAEQLATDGSALLVKAIEAYGEMSAKAAEGLLDPKISEEDKAGIVELRDMGHFLTAECNMKIVRPADGAAAREEAAVAAYEKYVKGSPKGRYAIFVYQRLSRIYARVGTDEAMEKALAALGGLRENFPESQEAKKSLPQLARSLVAFAEKIDDPDRRKKTVDTARGLYKEMIQKGGADYQPLDYVRAGEALVEVKDWNNASDAFKKAEQTAGPNQMSIMARARLGQARSYLAQGEYTIARSELDKYMENEKLVHLSVTTNACVMMIETALKQAESEPDAAARRSHYGAAIVATKRLNGFWGAKKDGKAAGTPLQLQWLGVRSCDISIAQMKIEEARGNKEEAAKARSKASIKLQSIIEARQPIAQATIKALPVTSPRRQELLASNDLLAKTYADYVFVLSQMGDDQKDEIVAVCNRFIQNFPDAKAEYKTIVANARESAIERGAKDIAPEAPAAEETVTPPAAEPAGEPAASEEAQPAADDENE